MTHALLTGTYCGDDPDLKNKTALLRETNAGLLAQFDNTNSRWDFGWHAFPNSAFREVKKLGAAFQKKDYDGANQSLQMRHEATKTRRENR